MKALVVLFIVFGIVLFSSCKKSYTCSCSQTTVTTGYTLYGVFHPQETSVIPFKNTIKDKKDKAVSACKNFESMRVDNFGKGESFRTVTTSVDCELY